MTNAVFKLEESGFSREQVNALTEFMDGSVATKADIAELSGELKGVRGELKADIERLNGKINIVYWMLALIIAVQVAPYLKTIFG